MAKDPNRLVSIRVEIPELQNLQINHDWVFKAFGETIAQHLQANFRGGRQGDDSAFKQRKHEDRIDNPPMNATGNMIRNTVYVRSSPRNKRPRVELSSKKVENRKGRSTSLNYFGLGNWLASETTGYQRRDFNKAVLRKIGMSRARGKSIEKIKLARGDLTIGKSGGNMGDWFRPGDRIIQLGRQQAIRSIRAQLANKTARLTWRKRVMAF